MLDIFFTCLQLTALCGFVTLVIRLRQSLDNSHSNTVRICLIGLSLFLVSVLAPLVGLSNIGLGPTSTSAIFNSFGLLVLLYAGWRFVTKSHFILSNTSKNLTRLPEEDAMSRHFQVAMNLIDQGFVVWDKDNKLVAYNKKFQEFLEYPESLLHPGVPLSKLIRYRADHGNYGKGDPAQLAEARLNQIINDRIAGDRIVTTQAGVSMLIRHYIVPEYGNITTFMDVTELRSKENQLVDQGALLQTALDNMTSGLVIYDDQYNIIMANKRFSDLFEFPEGLVYTGVSLESLIRFRNNRGDFGTADIDQIIQEKTELLANGEHSQTEEETINGRSVEAFRSPSVSGGSIIILNDITERLRAEIALRESEKTLLDILESSPIGISVIHDHEFPKKRAFINQAFIDMAGLKGDQVISDGLGPEGWVDTKEYYKFRALLYQGKSPSNIEVHRYRMDGAEWWCSLSTQKVMFEGHAAHVYWSIDVTKRIEVENINRGTERMLRQVLESSPIGISVIAGIDYDQRLFINDALLEMFKYDKTNLITKAPGPHTWAIPSEYEDFLLRIEQDEKINNMEALRYRNDGSTWYCALSVQEIEFEGQQAHVCWHLDITARISAELAIRENEKMLLQIFQQTPIGASISLVKNLNKRVFVNDALVKMYNVPTGQTLLELDVSNTWVNANDFRRSIDILENFGLIENYEGLSLRPDGSHWWALISSQSIEFEGEAAIIFWHIDISERKFAEEQLAEQEFMLRNVLDSSPLGIGIVEQATNKRLFANGALCKMLRVDSMDSLLQDDIADTWADAKSLDEMRALVVSGQDVKDFEAERIRADGSTWWCLVSIQNIQFDGKPARVAWCNDFSERKKMEQALVDSEDQLRTQLATLRDSEERLEEQSKYLVSQAKDMNNARVELERLNIEKDKLFTIIAHDLRGPFAGLVGVTELLATRSDELPANEISRLHQALHEAGQNLFELLENLLEWAQLQRDAVPFEPQVLKLEPLLRPNLALYKTLAASKNIQLNAIDIPPDLILTDPNMADTVLRNLIQNAIKFTPENGSVTVSAHADREWMWVQISDTGIGIPTELIDSIFKIDTTLSTPGTKGEVGSGLGLHVCNELIQKCGGKIDVISQEGQGATFKFSFPLA